MRQAATELSLPIFDPESINSPEGHKILQELQADLFLVADYGQILAPSTLALAPLGGMNLHGSLLPRYRGAAPVNWAIHDGQTETGVTVLHMTPRIDAGPSLAQATLTIEPDETAEHLEKRLCQRGGPLVAETVDRFVKGQITPIPQDKAQATQAPRLKKTDGALDWNRAATQLKNQWRALQPWPGCYTYWLRPGNPLRLIVGSVKIVEPSPSEEVTPGTVLSAEPSGIVVACGGRSALLLEQLQPAGKRMLTAAELLRGYPISPGDTMGNAET